MKKTFRTRTYEIHTDKLKNGHKVRFAFLTDLHGLIYGNNHQELYDAVLKHDPAAVLVAGDMIVNRKTETLQAAAVLLSRLSEKIPVFYTLGNHEYKMLLNPEVRQEYLNYERLLTSAGVCFLHNERISSNFCGTDFIFHGLELPIEYYHKPNSPKLSLTELEELLGTPFMSGIHILLAHNPKYGNTYLSWGADLVLSGHYHGGILRFGENHGLTCPQYLLLEDSVYSKPDFGGAVYVCAPPIRKKEDQDCLWKALADEEIQTVATDQCSFTLAQKALGKDDFTKIPGGLPGVQTRGTLLYTYGVKTGKITQEQMCKVLCENPAKLYGVYPNKGAITAGSDADIVVLDPAKESVISAATHAYNTDNNPFEGFKLECGIDKVFLRGNLAVEEGKLVKEKLGKYIARGKKQL